MPHSIAHRVTGITLATIAATALACKDSTGPRGREPGTTAADRCATDRTAPDVSGVRASVGELWAPDHALVPVHVSLVATDACSAVASAVTSVTSDEPEEGRGDGNTPSDWTLTGGLTVLLRAERSGLGVGRTYQLGITSTDASGNATASSATVFVPHDQGAAR